MGYLKDNKDVDKIETKLVIRKSLWKSCINLFWKQYFPDQTYIKNKIKHLLFFFKLLNLSFTGYFGFMMNRALLFCIREHQHFWCYTHHLLDGDVWWISYKMEHLIIQGQTSTIKGNSQMCDLSLTTSPHNM